ncbi:phospholipase D family protein [Tateyamaria pelophila]|uniref:phospholipase D family protein n=1 Tax=Tateyamaria pelophila TaxID=328415 RepID=UPI001CBDEEE7|nr:phospholipase D-like domain-containing protein [Tateyamaria pelophila]
MLKANDSTVSDAQGLTDVELLITAEEVYPAMERAFLAAETEIWASYRVFDLSTKLRSDEGRAIGTTWFDLIVHILERGVSLHMVLSDFDPIIGPTLHCASWRARRAFIAAKEAAGPDAKLDVINATHSARVGLLPRLLLWPRTVREVARIARKLNALPSADREKRLECSPGIRPWLKVGVGGTLSARKFRPPPLVPGTHHQKLAVFDRTRLCIGGLDLDERRYDDKDHNRRRDETWHDVQLMCRGAVVREAQQHLESFLRSVADREPAPQMRHLLRTMSKRRRIEAPFLGPRPIVSELAEAHHRMIGQARNLIYMETQFFRDRKIADTLAKAAQNHPDLGLVMVLPAAPDDVAFEGNTGSDARFGEYQQARCVARVQEAFGERLGLFSPARPVRVGGSGRDTLCGSPIIYVHAKVSIFDDAHAIVSSANLNARSFAWDTEAGVALERTQDVVDLRRRTFRHWLWPDAGKDYYDPKQAVGLWRDLALANAECDPSERKGFILPHDPAPAKAFGRRLPFVPDALV